MRSAGEGPLSPPPPVSQALAQQQNFAGPAVGLSVETSLAQS